MIDTILPGIVQRTVATPRYTANVLERPGGGGPAVVFIHANVSSALFYQPTMLALPADVHAVAIDLRGFGDSETKPVDATRGPARLLRRCVRGRRGARPRQRPPRRLVDGRRGRPAVPPRPCRPRRLPHARIAGVAVRIRRDPAGTVPGSPRTTRDGRRRGEPRLRRAPLQAGDRSADEPTSPRTVYRTAYVAKADLPPRGPLGRVDAHDEDRRGQTTPGDLVASEHWPGFGAGGRGVLNTMAPQYFDAVGIVDLAVKPADPLDPGREGRDRVRCVVLRPQHARKGRHHPRLAWRRGRAAAADGCLRRARCWIATPWPAARTERSCTRRRGTRRTSTRRMPSTRVLIEQVRSAG